MALGRRTRRLIGITVGIGVATIAAGCNPTPSNTNSVGQGATQTTVASHPSLKK